MDESTKYSLFVEGLSQKYPQAYRNVYCGISINEGWFGIVEALTVLMRNHIDWRRRTRAKQLLQNRAYKRGVEAVTAFVTKGKDRVTQWDEERIEGIMLDGLIEPAEKVHHVHVHQIKEKFGGLRFYYDGGDETVRGMVTMAEAWADHTCEVCGAPGTTRYEGWHKTLCDKHEEERQARMKSYDKD